jgi:allantoate deiminase
MSLPTDAPAVMDVCRRLSEFTEEPGFITRTFLADPMRLAHGYLEALMERAGMSVRLDDAGNLRGVYAAERADAPRLFVGSHLDTVPRGGAFDGVLGVMLAIAVVGSLGGQRLPFAIEVLGFSDEEGVRFGVPFIGSRALAGSLDDELLGRRDADGLSVGDVIRRYGLDPSHIDSARVAGRSIGYLEFHIEQGPVLDDLGLPLGIVDAIVGQTRLDVVFTGAANHAGTTPMRSRRDALACAAEWIGAVERDAQNVPGLVATVGSVQVSPGAVNVVAGSCHASLDVRHASDVERAAAVTRLTAAARTIAGRRGLTVTWESRLDQLSTAMDPSLTALLERAVARGGVPVHRMSSGAGHDAMIMAGLMPTAMLFVRSPGGISHHPDETVSEEDVAAALTVGQTFLRELAESDRWRI